MTHGDPLLGFLIPKYLNQFINWILGEGGETRNLQGCGSGGLEIRNHRYKYYLEIFSYFIILCCSGSQSSPQNLQASPCVLLKFQRHLNQKFTYYYLGHVLIGGPGD